MSGVILVLIGALLCLTGAWSLRLVVLAAGFGAAWVIADAFNASTATALIIGLAGAIVAFVVTLIAVKFLLFFVGAVVGAVVGAKLFVLLEGPDSSALLAVIFVPAVAVVFALLANRYDLTFVLWATAFGGAALVLSGLGRLAPSTLDALRAPSNTTSQVVLAVAWIALGLAGRAVQKRLPRQREARA